ncbi:uncharacterized protein GIQ15_01594 [Arthroderma uncinatum]|uniref:uncharacterized protein n=1 Tax=Arthroderma uncinatum TaxID=74035 RepID=UPI00144AEC30|nr:uncharacterized protein GIQ15_01594 [Arthroderma uncinatum]KAF3492077.1 hypothetical protein GIQ15_01594 [Arthroderma uncinatum]
MTSFQEARAAVEEPCLAKLVHWRGDDENGATVLEDVFREVIVISDDEDDDRDNDEEEAEVPAPYEDRRQNMEPMSSNAARGEAQHNYGAPRENYPFNPAGARQITGRDPSAANFVAVEPPKQYTERRNHDHRGFRRYEAWDRARTRYSNLVNSGSFVPAALEPREQYSPRYSRVEPRSAFPDVGGHHVQLSPTRERAVTTRPTDHIRREVIADYAQPIGSYTSAGFTAPQEREPLQRYHRPADHASFPPAFERTQQAYVSRQSPVPSNLHRASQLESRRSYPPSEDTRYGLVHHEHPQPRQGPTNEARDYPILPSIESPMAPASRPERQEEYDTRMQSPMVISGQPVSRTMRPLGPGPPPQPDRTVQTPHPRTERHWDDPGYTRAIEPSQRPYSHSGLYQNEFSPPVASQAQPLRRAETLARPAPGQRIVRVSQQSGGFKDYPRHVTESWERGVSHQAIANQGDTRRVASRYPYPDNPAIVIRHRHSMNSRLVAYPDDPPTAAGNRLTQVRLYDRPVETRPLMVSRNLFLVASGPHDLDLNAHTYMTQPGEARYSTQPLQQHHSSNYSSETADMRYSYVASDRPPPGTYPSAASAFHTYRSPPPQVRTSESTPTISHPVAPHQLDPAHSYVQGQPYTREYL